MRSLKVAVVSAMMKDLGCELGGTPAAPQHTGWSRLYRFQLPAGLQRTHTSPPLAPAGDYASQSIAKITDFGLSALVKRQFLGAIVRASR